MMKKVVRTEDFPVVRTKKGKVHGYKENDVYHFLGIRYGRAKRFELPEETESWKGIRDAKAYGYVCPLLKDGRDTIASTRHKPGREFNPMADPFANFEMQHVYWPMDEDCLFLNIWTKHISASEENSTCEISGAERDVRRPVFFWLHGGGYGAGSSVEIPSYDGHNLSDFGDIVVVSINHRLNCLGFLDLSSFGEAFKSSGAAGLADIVLALRWVRENIAAFGGDPDNITVGGQSGGGGKALALLQMPAADGLYKRIISQSGALGGLDRAVGPTNRDEKRRWQALGEKTAEVLGLNSDTIDRIRDIPYELLADAAEEAGRQLGYAEGMMLFEPSPVSGLYEGRYETVGFREEAKDIPVLAGTVLGEFNFMHYLGNKDTYTDEERRAILEEAYGEDTDDVLREFMRVYPSLDTLYALSADRLFRPVTMDYLRARKEYTDAPCYNYQMSFIIPYKGGVAPWHCSCIPYAFRNVEKEPAHCTGAGIYAERVQDEVSGAWVAFMTGGDPSTASMEWRQFTAQDPCRMEFSERSHMTDADDGGLLEVLRRHP